MPVVQNIVRNDLCVTEWLLGTWQAEKGGYHLNFYRTNSDEISCQYSLPWISPEGTSYYGCQNLMLQVSEEENNGVWMDIYQFNLLEPNKIEFFYVLDQKTYTMVRK